MSIPVTINGVKYRSVRQACIALNKHQSSVYFCLKKGYTLEQAITLPGLKAIVSRDHLGKEYSSLKKMCEAWNKKYSIVHDRLKDGWSIEDALTTPVNAKWRQPQGTPSKDHLGKIYPSIQTMCKAWGINGWTFSIRLNKGWSIEKALTTPPLTRNGRSKKCT